MRESSHGYDPEPPAGLHYGAVSTQAVNDLLLLTSLAANVTLVVIGFPQQDASWRIQWAGRSAPPPVPSELLDRLATRPGPTEIPDLLAEMLDSPIVSFPSSMRWAFGVPIHDVNGGLIAVVTLLDPWLRTRSHREDLVLRNAARRIKDVLVAQSSPMPKPVNAGVLEVRSNPSGVDAQRPPTGRLLRSSEVAAIFDVTERTILNWAAEGKIPSMRTLGGHLRFRKEHIDDLLVVSQGPEWSAR